MQKCQLIVGCQSELVEDILRLRFRPLRQAQGWHFQRDKKMSN